MDGSGWIGLPTAGLRCLTPPPRRQPANGRSDPVRGIPDPATALIPKQRLNTSNP